MGGADMEVVPPLPSCMHQGGKRGGMCPNPKHPLGSHARATCKHGSSTPPLPCVCAMGASKLGGVLNPEAGPILHFACRGNMHTRSTCHPFAPSRGALPPPTQWGHMNGRGMEMGGVQGPHGMGHVAPFLLTCVHPLQLRQKKSP